MKYTIMTLKHVKTSALKEHPALPEYCGQSAKMDLHMMALSIKEAGVLVPIVIDKQNRVIDGWLRVRAAQACGIKKIPAVVVDTDNAFTAHCALNIGTWKGHEEQ